MLDRKVLGSYLASNLIDSLDNDNFSISIKDPELHIVGLSGSEVNLMFTKALLALPFKQAKFDVDFFSLFKNPNTKIAAKLYSGDIDADLSIGETFTGKVIAKQIDISAIPQFQALGFSRGFLSFQANPIRVNNNVLESILLTVDLDKLHKPNNTQLPGKLVNLPFDISIPEINSLTAHTKLEVIERSKFILSPIDIKSSLGAFNGDLSGTLNSVGRIASANGDFKVNLSQSGSEEFGSLLPLISSSSLKASDKSFSLKLEINPRGTILRAVPLKN
ncbi:MAG: hypothetical protein KDD56_00325 [Bdellovibrionales bacterium]|nr:hypothetical protein [Bdellovibrionales bacterium]